MSSVELTRKIQVSLRACGEKVNHPGGIWGHWTTMFHQDCRNGFQDVHCANPNLRRCRSILFSDELLTGPACLMRGSHLPGAFHRCFFISVFPMFFFPIFPRQTVFFFAGFGNKMHNSSSMPALPEGWQLAILQSATNGQTVQSSHIKTVQRRF